MISDAQVTPSGSVAVGSIYIYTTEGMGRKMETKTRVSQFEQNQIWAFKTIGVPQAVETIFEFGIEGSATKLTLRMNIPAGAYPVAAEGMIKQQMQKTLEDQCKQLKQLLEK